MRRVFLTRDRKVHKDTLCADRNARDVYVCRCRASFYTHNATMQPLVTRRDWSGKLCSEFLRDLIRSKGGTWNGKIIVRTGFILLVTFTLLLLIEMSWILSGWSTMPLNHINQQSGATATKSVFPLQSRKDAVCRFTVVRKWDSPPLQIMLLRFVPHTAINKRRSLDPESRSRFILEATSVCTPQCFASIAPMWHHTAKDIIRDSCQCWWVCVCVYVLFFFP